MIHPRSLGQWLQGRGRESFDLRVGLRDEMVVEDNVNVLRIYWPLTHPYLVLNRTKILDIWAVPAPQHMIQ